MLTTHDIGELFQAMRIAYGPQWKHGATAIETWRRALGRSDPPDIHGAANRWIETNAKNPPSLPEFRALLQPRPRANHYLPPPQIRDVVANANCIMFRVLTEAGGVDSHCLRNMVGLKNALVDEPDMTAKELERQLTELARGAA